MPCLIQEAIERIGQMERCLDTLRSAAAKNPAVIFKDPALGMLLESLTQYYESGQWLQDYALDEQGLLPKNLKRGVLAQDTLFDFFDRIREIEGALCACEIPDTVI